MPDAMLGLAADLAADNRYGDHYGDQQDGIALSVSLSSNGGNTSRCSVFLSSILVIHCDFVVSGVSCCGLIVYLHSPTELWWCLRKSQGKGVFPRACTS